MNREVFFVNKIRQISSPKLSSLIPSIGKGTRMTGRGVGDQRQDTGKH